MIEGCAGGCGFALSLYYSLRPILDWLSTSTDAVASALPWFFPVMAAFVGAGAASLAGLVVHRLPRMQGWNGRTPDRSIGLFYPRSHCDHCGTPLSAVSLIPVIGWFASRGRCESCGREVPWLYPAIEATVAVMSFALVMWKGAGLQTFVMLVAAWWLVYVAWIDWAETDIPDSATFPLFFLGALATPFEPDIQARLLGALLAGLAVMGAFKLTSSIKEIDGDVMSLGDVTLATALGAWVGLCGVAPFLLASCLVYIAYAAPLRGRGILWVPMGPALCLGGVIAGLSGLKLG